MLGKWAILLAVLVTAGQTYAAALNLVCLYECTQSAKTCEGRCNQSDDCELDCSIQEIECRSRCVIGEAAFGLPVIADNMPEDRALVHILGELIDGYFFPYAFPRGFFAQERSFRRDMTLDPQNQCYETFFVNQMGLPPRELEDYLAPEPQPDESYRQQLPSLIPSCNSLRQEILLQWLLQRE